jgi:hypothetical protein
MDSGIAADRDTTGSFDGDFGEDEIKVPDNAAKGNRELPIYYILRHEKIN